jgi:hypothetical protein
MLFLHKGADRAIIHAVYTGEVPKGNEASYDLVTPHDFVRVATNARHVMRALGIRESSHLGLMRILFSWIQATAYDLQQATIYTMMSAEGMEARRRAGISANWRYYNNYIDLVLALYGEYLSKTNLIREGLVARLVLASPRIAAQMVSLATKISLHVEITFRAEQSAASLDGADNGRRKNHERQHAYEREYAKRGLLLDLTCKVGRLADLGCALLHGSIDAPGRAKCRGDTPGDYVLRLCHFRVLESRLPPYSDTGPPHV